jgi:hypothetical protein
MNSVFSGSSRSPTSKSQEAACLYNCAAFDAAEQYVSPLAVMQPSSTYNWKEVKGEGSEELRRVRRGAV